MHSCILDASVMNLDCGKKLLCVWRKNVEGTCYPVAAKGVWEHSQVFTLATHTQSAHLCTSDFRIFLPVQRAPRRCHKSWSKKNLSAFSTWTVTLSRSCRNILSCGAYQNTKHITTFQYTSKQNEAMLKGTKAQKINNYCVNDICIESGQHFCSCWWDNCLILF